MHIWGEHHKNGRELYVNQQGSTLWHVTAITLASLHGKSMFIFWISLCMSGLYYLSHLEKKKRCTLLV